MSLKGRSVSSQTLGEICSVTFDVKDEPSGGSISPGVAEDTSVQRGRPERRRVDGESPDVDTEREEVGPDAAGNGDRASEADEEDEMLTGAEVSGGPEDHPGGSEVVREQEEPQTIKPDESSEMQGRAPASSAAETATDEEVKEAGGEDTDDDDEGGDDDGVIKEKPEDEADLKDEDEAADVDSLLSKDAEKKALHRTGKQESSRSSKLAEGPQRFCSDPEVVRPSPLPGQCVGV